MEQDPVHISNQNSNDSNARTIFGGWLTAYRFGLLFALSLPILNFGKTYNLHQIKNSCLQSK